MKQITPAQHLAATAKPAKVKSWPLGTFTEAPRFAKFGETQDAAIKRFMSALKRNIRKPETRNFPSDSVSLSCTKNYVEKFYGINFGHGNLPFSNLSTSPTTHPEGLDVEVSHVDDDISDLI